METYIKVDNAYIDISSDEWKLKEIIEDAGFEDETEINEELKAVLIFEHYGAYELGENKDFDNEEKALQELEYHLNQL